MYDYEKETEISVDKKGYIVVYAYAGRITQKEAKYILKFAKKYNKEISQCSNEELYFALLEMVKGMADGIDAYFGS